MRIDDCTHKMGIDTLFFEKSGHCGMICSQIFPAVDGQNENDKNVILDRINQAVSLLT